MSNRDLENGTGVDADSGDGGIQTVVTEGALPVSYTHLTPPPSALV